jgi:hypothetical protein
MIIYAIISGQADRPDDAVYFHQFEDYAIAKIEQESAEGWELYDTSEELNIRRDELEAMNTPEAREAIIDTLTNAAESSGLSVPFESFFYANRKVVIDWILNGGDSLKKVFIESTVNWMDMRADEESPSPREYALNLLN